MGLQLLTDRHSEQIAGTLSCYDRVLIQGTLPGLCYAEGMTGYLYAHHVRIFDYAQWAQPLRETLRENAERLAAENGLEIEFIRRPKSFRKEDKIHQVLKERGDHPGLVWIFSVMEPCSTYQPWHDKAMGKTYLRPDDSKCLHYYFYYFIDEELGLCYVRVPTWCPFRLQIYLNGHHRLAYRLERKQIDHTRIDNAFVEIADFERAQKIADDWPVEKLHRKLDEWAERYCPVILQFEVRYHWSLDQVEFSTDLLFHRREDLQAIYGYLTRTAIHTVKPDNIATFLGHKLSPLYQGEMGNRFNTRIEGTRIKHTMGPVSVKMYDKFGLILRIEVTVNNVSFFQHYRTVEQRDGRTVTKWAPMKKSIYSLPALREALDAVNRRYLEFLSTLDDPTAGIDRLQKASEPARENDQSYPGLNFFSAEDQTLIKALARGEFNLWGLQNKTLRTHLDEKTSGQVSRLLKRLRLHGLIKKVGHTYRYYLTVFGKQVIASGLKLKNLVPSPNWRSPLRAEQNFLPNLVRICFHRYE